MAGLPDPDYLAHPLLQPAAPLMGREARLEALSRFLPALQKALIAWASADRPDLSARIGPGDAILADLQERGHCVVSLPDALNKMLADRTAAEFESLQAELDRVERPRFRNLNRALDRERFADVYAAWDEALGDLHVRDAASAYMRRRLRLRALYIQLNDARETSVRYGPIDPAGLPAVRTHYWHIDSDIWPCVKAIAYLNDVGLDQGPLRYVEGSHIGVSDFETVVRKTNDTLKLPMHQFMSLPQELRRHALFGPYLTGREEGVEEMMRRERALCAQAASVILFDNNGVHRGGFVRSGVRRIIQCLFEAAD
jgi:hypothetical protein